MSPESNSLMPRLTTGLIRHYGKEGEHPTHPRAAWKRQHGSPAYWEWVVERLLDELPTKYPQKDA